MAKPQMKQYLYKNIKNGYGNKVRTSVKKCFDSLQNSITSNHKNDLNTIFLMNLRYPALFPTEIFGKKGFTPKSYLTKWARSFYRQWNKGLPSQTVATPKGSPNDPDVQLIVQKCLDLTPCKAEEGSKIHNFFMSAENIQGKLLEEYIYKHTFKHGWNWARGTIVRACDFVKPGFKNPFIQIKNRYNSENSSSKSIRDTMKNDYKIKICRWYRSPQDPQPKNIRSQWTELNQLMGIHGADSMSNKSYRNFLTKVVKNNPKIINGD